MDGRRNNGGHSTKSKGVDKRKNQYRKALDQAAGVEEVVEVLKMLYTKATSKQDVKAAQLFLSYYLGKPESNINLNAQEGFTIPLTEFFGSEDK